MYKKIVGFNYIMLIVINSIFSQSISNWKFENYTVGNHNNIGYTDGSVIMPEIFSTDSNTYRLFYNVGIPDTCNYIKYAESTDGINWIAKGIALEGVNDTADPTYISGGARILKLSNGKYRMFYRTSKYTNGGQPLYHIRSAISDDGTVFTRESGIRISIHEYDSNSVFQTAAHASVFKGDNGLFICIFTASLTTDPLYGEASDLYISTSTDEGYSWNGFKKIYEDCHDPVVIKKDGIYYLFMAYLDSLYLTATSADGISWPQCVDTLHFTDSLNNDLTDTISDIGGLVNINNEIELYTNYGVPSTNIARFLPSSNTVSNLAYFSNWKIYRTIDSLDGINFSIDSTGILPTLTDYGVPALNLCADSSIQIGYSEASINGRASAIANQSLNNWLLNTNNCLPHDVDGDFIYLPNACIRFIVAQLDGSTSKIVSYLSTDGLNWAIEEGVRYQPDALEDTLAGVPCVVQLQDSVWRMYYVADLQENAGGLNIGNGIRTAISYNWGYTWTKEITNNLLPSGNVDPHLMYLSTGGYRLYFRSSTLNGIAYVDSPDGLNFDFSKAVTIVNDDIFGLNNKFFDPYLYKLTDGSVSLFMGANGINGNSNSRVVHAIQKSTLLNINNEAPNENFNIYPNPTNDVIYIKSNLESSNTVLLRIYNQFGFLVMHKEWQHSIENKIDISSLSSGCYFYEINNSKGKIMLIK